MGDFEKAFKKVMKYEGGYNNDKNDLGGETFKGISRHFHPGWLGWSTIDSYKKKSGFPDNLKENAEFDAEIKEFYKVKFWDVFFGDRIEQSISEEMFDISVNMHPVSAIFFLQDGLNILNREQKDYKNIKEDGVFGNKTFNALKACLKKRSPDILFKILNLKQGNHYIKRMNQNETQEKFVMGWLKRVTFKKR